METPTQNIEVDRLARLTDREREVAACIHKGMKNTQAASALGISSKTVSAHLSAIYRTLGIQSSRELVLVVERARERAKR